LGALKLLLEYNKEDVINLIPLEEIFTQQLKALEELKEMSNDGAV
jgi:uncharacterized protein YprB with RNaseH-like and TPR domain